MSNYIPKEGDIVMIDFEPNAGREIDKVRPGLVLSPEAFNQKTKMAYIAPISSGAKWAPDQLAIPVPDAMATTGRILTWQVSAFDYQARGARFKERVPKSLLARVRVVVSKFMGLN